MPNVMPQKTYSKDPGAYTGTIIGTAAGTATISSEPAFFQGVIIPTRVASGAITIYDSVGTSSNVIGTITLGTQTFSDPPPLYEFKIATKNALTVVNTANLGAIVMYR